MLAWFPGTPVVLAAPLGSGSWLNTRLQQFGEAPCAFILGAKPGRRFERVAWFDIAQTRLASRRRTMRTLVLLLALAAVASFAAGNSISIRKSRPRSPKSKPSTTTLIPSLPAAGRHRLRCAAGRHMEPVHRTGPHARRIAAHRRRRPRQLFRMRRTPKERRYANWVLDQLGIETMLANRVAMGRVSRRRDSCGCRLKTRCCSRSTTPASRQQFRSQGVLRRRRALLKRYLKECGLASPPATLDEYLAKVVDATLERQKRGGAVAIKFEAAYLRSLDFETFRSADGRSSLPTRGAPPDADYKKLQDFLFRYIAAEGRTARHGRPSACRLGRGRIFRHRGHQPAAARIRVQRSEPASHQFRHAARRLAVHARNDGAAFQTQCLRRFLRANAS